MIALPEPEMVETTYHFEDGPIVTNYEGRRVRLTQAVVTDFLNDEEPLCHASGYVVTATGERDRRCSYQVSVVGSGLDREILAAHFAG